MDIMNKKVLVTELDLTVLNMIKKVVNVNSVIMDLELLTVFV